MKVEILRGLAERLERLGRKEREPYDRYLGICHDLHAHWRVLVSEQEVVFEVATGAWLEYAKVLQEAFESWPEFSGEAEYPVPHIHMRAGKAYMDSQELWEDNEYGDARRRLCLHAAAVFLWASEGVGDDAGR